MFLAKLIKTARARGPSLALFFSFALPAFLLSPRALAGDTCVSLPLSDTVPLVETGDDSSALGRHQIYRYNGNFRLQYLGFLGESPSLAHLNAFDLEFDTRGKLLHLATVNLSSLRGEERFGLVRDLINKEIAVLQDHVSKLEASKSSELAQAKKDLAHTQEFLKAYDKGDSIEYSLWLSKTDNSKKVVKNPFESKGAVYGLDSKQHFALVNIANREDVSIARTPASGSDTLAGGDASNLGSKTLSALEIQSLPAGLTDLQVGTVVELAERYRKQMGCETHIKASPGLDQLAGTTVVPAGSLR